MEIDRELFAESLHDDIQYIRDHLLKVVLTAAVGVGIGMFVTGWLGAVLLAAGVGHSLYTWIAAVNAADGDPPKVQEARRAYVRFLEAFVLAGGIRLLRACRSGGGEERLPDLVRPQPTQSIASTTAAGQELSKAFEAPDPDVHGLDGRLRIPALGGASPRLDDVAGGSQPAGDFIPMSPAFFGGIRALKDMRPPERYEALQQVMIGELTPHFVPIPTFRLGKHPRLLVEAWVLELPSSWIEDAPVNWGRVAGHVADLINQVLEHWTVALRVAKSPTLKALVLRNFSDRIVVAVESGHDVIPLPVKNPERVDDLVAAVHGHLEWKDLRKELAQARRDYKEPTPNWMITILEDDHLSTLEATAERVKQRIRKHAHATGGKQASRWATQQYDHPTDATQSSASAVRAPARSIRHDNLRFDDTYYFRAGLARRDWAHPEANPSQRLSWLAELLNTQLENWGVPRLKVIAGSDTRIDLRTWTLFIAGRLLVPELVVQWARVHELLAYHGVKILQQWKILKYRLRTMPPDRHHDLELDFPKAILAAAMRQPMTAEEQQRAKMLYDSIDSPERLVANHQLARADAELNDAENAVTQAAMDLELADDFGKRDAALRLGLASDARDDANANYEKISHAFSMRPEEDEAYRAVIETLRRARELW